MRVIRLTKRLVRRLKVGQTGVWQFPSDAPIASAKVTISKLKKLEGMDFERLDVPEEHTIAYKRIK